MTAFQMNAKPVNAFAASASGASVVLVIAAIYASPSSRLHALIPPCPFHALTGYYCPGCGATRAMHALFHGDVAGAISNNVLVVGAFPFLMVYLTAALRNLLAGQASPWPMLSVPPRWVWALSV